MDKHSRSVRRGRYHIGVPALHRTNLLAQEKIEEPSNATLSSIVLDSPAVGRAVAPSRRTAKRGGYDRNNHRYLDEKRYLRKRRRLLYAVPTLAFTVVASIALIGPFANQPEVLSSQQANAVSGGPTVVPLAGSSDQQPATNYLETYKVAADRPRVVSIESIGLEARVLEVGVDGRIQPQLPKNSYDTGWYNVSVKPGQSGAVVLSGACSGSVGQGAFHRLGDVEEGNEIVIERGDGVNIAYRVAGMEQVAVENLDMATVLRPMNGSDQGLSLVGCSGTYNPKTNDFSERTVVYALRI